MRTTSQSISADFLAIASITQSADVARLLSEVIQEERNVDNSLEEMLQRRHTFEELLSTAVQEAEEVFLSINTLKRV